MSATENKETDARDFAGLANRSGTLLIHIPASV